MSASVSPPRLGAVHALSASLSPTQAAFERAWPQADVAHLLDGSLYLDRSRGTADEAEIERRIDRLIQHSAATGAQGILFTGSFFGDAVRKARENVTVPVLTSFDGVIARALELAQPLAVISSAPDSARLLKQELEQQAQACGQSVDVSSHVIDGAMQAIEADEMARHDTLVLDSIQSLGSERAIVIAQFSMERVIETAQQTVSVPLLGAATEGAAELRRRLST